MYKIKSFVSTKSCLYSIVSKAVALQNDGYKCITMNVCSIILSLDMYVMLFSTFRVYELIFLNILIWKQRFFWVLENKQLV